MPDVSIGHDGVARCSWDYPAEYRWYHDDEWGRPVVDDGRIYEKLCLEGFQSGLSWLPILRKRDSFGAPSPASTWRRSPRSTSATWAAPR